MRLNNYSIVVTLTILFANLLSNLSSAEPTERYVYLDSRASLVEIQLVGNEYQIGKQTPYSYIDDYRNFLENKHKTPIINVQLGDYKVYFSEEDITAHQMDNGLVFEAILDSQQATPNVPTRHIVSHRFDDILYYDNVNQNFAMPVNLNDVQNVQGTAEFTFKIPYGNPNATNTYSVMTFLGNDTWKYSKRDDLEFITGTYASKSLINGRLTTAELDNLYNLSGMLGSQSTDVRWLLWNQSTKFSIYIRPFIQPDGSGFYDPMESQILIHDRIDDENYFQILAGFWSTKLYDSTLICIEEEQDDTGSWISSGQLKILDGSTDSWYTIELEEKNSSVCGADDQNVYIYHYDQLAERYAIKRIAYKELSTPTSLIMHSDDRPAIFQAAL